MPMASSVTYSPNPEGCVSAPVIPAFQNTGYISSSVCQGVHVAMQQNSTVQRISSGPLHNPVEPYRNSAFQGSFQPFLTIIEQPKKKWRYRYQSEKGSHGGLPGHSTSSSKRTFPAVKLNNYSGSQPIYIKASLWTTDDDTPSQHVHKLCGSRCQDDGTCIVKLSEDNTAVFQDMTILFVAKKDVPEILLKRKLEQLGLSCASDIDVKQLRKEAQNDAKKMNYSSVKICFEAFYDDFETKQRRLICPLVFSDPVANQKSPDAGDLKICRMSRIAGSVKGGEDVFLLCAKVNKKDISVRYYEEDSDWEAYGKFTEADVHYQYAIVFQTPPYHRTDITKPVNVFVQLQRSNGEASEPKVFTYVPRDEEPGTGRKRKKNNSYEFGGSGNLSYGAYGVQDSHGPVQTSVIDNHDSAHGSSHGSTLNCIEHIENVDSHAEDMDDLVCDDLLRLIESPIKEEEFEMMMNNLDSNTLLEDSTVLIKPHKDPFLSQANVQMPYFSLFDTSNTSGIQHGSTSSMKTDSSPQVHEDAIEFQSPEFIVTSDREVHDQRNHPVIGKLGQQSQQDVRLEQLEHSFNQLSILKEGEGKTCAKSDSVSVRKKECNSKKQSVELKQRVFLNHLFTEGPTKKIWSHLPTRSKALLLCYSNEDGDTLLHLCIMHQWKDIKLLESLLESAQYFANSPINSANKKKQTPLHLAVLVQEPSFVRLLLLCGADPLYPDQNGCTSIHLAINLKNMYCLQELLEHNNYVYSKERFHLQCFNYEGFSPLHCAVIENSVEYVELLCRKGANVNIPSRKDGRTPLHFAVHKDIMLVKLLLAQKDINVNAQDFAGNTVLHLACALKRCDVIRELLLAGGNPMIQNFENDLEECCASGMGRTPYDFASEDEEIVKILDGFDEDYAIASNYPEKTVISQSMSLGQSFDSGRKKTVKVRRAVPHLRKGTEHNAQQNDSGYISGPLAVLSDEVLKEVCRLLDPPSDKWKDLMLFTIFDDAFQENILKLTPSSPTKSVIETFLRNGGDVDMLICALEAANLTEAQSVLRGYQDSKN